MTTNTASIDPDTVNRGDVDKLQDLIFPIRQDVGHTRRRAAPDDGRHHPTTDLTMQVERSNLGIGVGRTVGHRRALSLERNFAPSRSTP